MCNAYMSRVVDVVCGIPHTTLTQRQPELPARQGSEMEYHHENNHLSLGCGPHRQRDTLRPLFCKEPPPRGSLSTDIGFRSLSSDWVQWKPLTFNTSRQSLPAAYGRFPASAQRCDR